MSNGGAIRGFRRRRFAIGLIAAYGLLVNLLVSALGAPAAPSAADSLDAFLAQQICASGGDSQHHSDPAAPAHHAPDCPLCGTTCPMGGCAPVSPFIAKLAPVEPALTVARVEFHPAPAVRPGFARYPSDAVSQAPPQAA
ncbi:MAG TPA: DUF2946 family protein [Dongiaceae bacterium]|nr:DUF2946 family protein [Dongiaceae bacterium]